MSEQKNLFDKFPPVSTKEWMDRITADLKGEDFNKKLVWNTPEGISLMPFYRQEDIQDLPFINSLPGESPYLRGTETGGNNWLVRQDIDVEDYRNANRKALDILMKGVDSLGFVIKNPDSVSQHEFNRLLDGIHLESIEINFISEGKAKEILDCLIRIFQHRKQSDKKIRGVIEADPLGRLMLNGKLCISLEAGLDYLADLTTKSLSLPYLRTVDVHGSWLANEGADTVKELAFALSMGNEYMSVLTDRNLTPDQAASKMRFTFGIGPNYFFEIARLRAARLLWSVITGAYGPIDTGSAKMQIHSVTSHWNKSENDPYINLLRTQTEAMSAALGGADSITVEPFDRTFRKPDEFSERIARNQQLLLKEEAYFEKVKDPAGGSWYIEKLTSLIAEEAWKLFIKVEDQGGFVAALKNGFIRDGIKSSAQMRAGNK
ncbi:MAG: methylmalonyl-CoA mutase subunit beta [Bacteroidales bacterium]|jgi:methylmalonyl-CoA mutase